MAPIDDKGAQSAIGPISTPQVDTDELVTRWVQLQEAHAPAEQIQQAEQRVADALKQPAYELRKQLPFFQQMVKKLEGSQAFQQFHLPGRDRVVEDNRAKHEQGRPAEEAKAADKNAAAKEAATEATDAKKGEHLRLQEGKLVKHREAGYANYLGDRSRLRHGALDREAAGERVDRMLSAFEEMVVARFEEGRQVAQQNADGKPKFLEKTEAQWREFFKSFVDRTVQKKVLISEIRDFLFRGLVSKGAKGVVISDIRLEGGRVEKFVRFSILAEALSKLKTLMPGEIFGKGALGNLSGEELMILALAVSRGQEYATSPQAAQGRVMGGKAEAQAAEALGIPLDQHLRQKAKQMRGRKGGPLGGFGDEGGAGDELPYQFIPWYSPANLTQHGARNRWITIAFYGTLVALALIGIGAMTLRVLGGM